MTAISLKLFGRQEMQRKLLSVVKNADTRIGDALMAEMEIELQEVIKRTPKDTGALRESEKLIGPAIEGNSVVVLIIAGGPDAPYAMLVHEDLEMFHKVGQAKYLESVLMEARTFIGPRVAKRLKISDWVS